ncbi:glycosyltransferase family 2 protein [Aurantibacter sp.]|uniref:glycosyltransferase family 2 protein n=1 Tax=Aurantibacter sp. TaxID=2807103 RepID=UPI003264E292
MKKIIVLTPIKNEEWILDIFLKTTSCFADHILLADQNSDDNSASIAKKFPKVDVIKNNSSDFNEAERQTLLINTARDKYGSNNILLAIDADEIVAFSSLKSKEWELIKYSEPGTILFFEKPTFYNGVEFVIRYQAQGGWPLGFVDDGTQHKPEFIHSTRIPFNDNAPKLVLKEIKLLHCNLLSLRRQRAKVRYYCILESIANSKPWYHRLRMYRRSYDYAKQEGDGLAPAPIEWTDGWIKKGIVFKQPEIMEHYWHDRESLKLLKKYQFRTFWFEDVWDVNWKNVGDYFKITDVNYNHPSIFISLFREMTYYLIKFVFFLKNLI